MSVVVTNVAAARFRVRQHPDTKHFESARGIGVSVYRIVAADALEGKRGTVIRSIRLTGDPQEIDCRHDTIKGLVLRAEFVKKS